MNRAVCVDHLTLPVTDLEASRLFYAAALGGLGWSEVSVENMPTWGPPGGEDFSIAPGAPPPQGLHLAFVADTREQVDQFHAGGLAAGGRDNGAPGPRPQYHAGYYAAYLLDPDGNNEEAVLHERLESHEAPPTAV
jgi:catechol 2,3-dioxygenase-like lactoylglutathione lyase family enzyme